MRALLHADGGANVGLGHASRCSALCEAFNRAGHEASILVDPGSGLSQYLLDLGISAVENSASPASLRDAASRVSADIIVIDSYRWSSADFAAIRCLGTPVVAFDDEARRNLPVDAIINGAPTARSLAYAALPSTRLLLGPDYQVIREAFRETTRRVAAGVLRRMIVLVGGADPLGLLPRLARQLNALAAAAEPEFDVELICGPFVTNPDTTALPRVRTVRNPPDLRDRMLAADIAISSSGQTLYELARCGTPTIAFCSGEDQVHNLSALAEAGIVWSAGNADQGDWPATIEEGIHALAADPALRDRLSVRAQGLFDGHGADRLVLAMERILQENKTPNGGAAPDVSSVGYRST